ncbi:foldase protein PrsA [Desulforudis sp. DRI-14]|uniref:foldase protein PrsA n=1 Tax=Desulforudis sp. DRI-14 TaxID=3459793 RepID=UPI00404344F7
MTEQNQGKIVKAFNFKMIGLAVFAVLVLALAGAWWNGRGEVLARVNGEKLTKEQLYQEMYKLVGRETQEDLVDRMLIMQEAEEKGIKVTPEEIQAELKSMKDTWGIASDEELDRMLALQGSSLEKVKEQIAMWHTVRKLIAPTVTVTDDEARQYFTDHPDEFGQPEQVKVRHILVDTRDEAVSILQDLRRGADFSKIAEQKSKDHATAGSGGDLGFIKKGQMVPEFEKAAFSLNLGEISDVVQTQYGYHIIQALEKKAAVNPAFEDIKDDVKTRLIDQKIQEKFDSWLAELRSRANIEYADPQ